MDGCWNGYGAGQDLVLIFLFIIHIFRRLCIFFNKNCRESENMYCFIWKNQNIFSKNVLYEYMGSLCNMFIWNLFVLCLLILSYGIFIGLFGGSSTSLFPCSMYAVFPRRLFKIYLMETYRWQITTRKPPQKATESEKPHILVNLLLSMSLFISYKYVCEIIIKFYPLWKQSRISHAERKNYFFFQFNTILIIQIVETDENCWNIQSFIP